MLSLQIIFETILQTFFLNPLQRYIMIAIIQNITPIILYKNFTLIITSSIIVHYDK